MSDPSQPAEAVPALSRAVVLRVGEDECEVLQDGVTRVVRFTSVFPSPRTERVRPGHLVAVATTPDGTQRVVWRWFDAVVLGEEAGRVRLWEPAHGEVLAQPRAGCVPGRPGTRAYLSAGLPGADWWVAGPSVADAEEADVELDEVEAMFTRHGLWDTPA